MSRLFGVLKGVAALLALVGLTIGVPLLLVKAAGWPLPSHVPSPQAVGDALTREGVPAEVIVKAVAVVIWVAWFQLVLSVAIEVVVLVRHRQLGRVRGLGGSRVVAAALVTAASGAAQCLRVAPSGRRHGRRAPCDVGWRSPGPGSIGGARRTDLEGAATGHALVDRRGDAGLG